MSPLVEARDLGFRYDTNSRRSNGPLTLDAVNFSIEEGQTVGVIGESGSGKSTLIRILCGLLVGASGSATFRSRSISDWLGDDPSEFRRHNQIVFQNPASSLDPRMRIGRSLAEPVKSIERRRPSVEEMETWLSRVGMDGDVLRRYPHQLSGGQLQRVGIARALSVGPTVLYADEPTSALDVSVQAHVLNLLMDLRDELGLTLVIVSHDLAVISRMSEKLVVMRSGRVVESGPTGELVRSPKEPYTAALIDAANAVSLTVDQSIDASRT